MPLLGADPINRAYHFLAHNSVAVVATSLFFVIASSPNPLLSIIASHLREFACLLRRESKTASLSLVHNPRS
jgi:hypothetical protein